MGQTETKNSMTIKKENKSSNLQQALDYVRRELGIGALTVVRYQRNVGWLRRQPITTDHDDEILALLNDWGEAHGLPEDWWDFEGVDFEDILEIL